MRPKWKKPLSARRMKEFRGRHLKRTLGHTQKERCEDYARLVRLTGREMATELRSGRMWFPEEHLVRGFYVGAQRPVYMDVDHAFA